ncbi:DUF2175 family protein [Sulfuracidifex metallicus]|uniref:DUF2175 domain-containing protein n=1 Tax=Sulfuracidifex metallicus DSM 6482 = JCM 9184 TaxID=523847 RepID=A0A6A9QM72_SULME|nr:DUF2175 family protein [Sulfuracidifex metallicus]MUN28365.1 DUF2175 domain-containing protein [Sulfuracidifex metallicus DSM 6482 = JCM 9184]WOE51116.1 DUF2175 family protein [Sulfuracidifex metallicus DSM 6482 = JCM 9184]
MSRPATKWTCAFCGNTIYWDELFTFMKSGVVHYTCFRDKAMKTSKIPPNEMQTVLDLLEKELSRITEYKKVMSSITNEEIKKSLDQIEKDAEKQSGVLTRIAAVNSQIEG